MPVTQHQLIEALKTAGWPYVAVVSRQTFWELQQSYEAETFYDTSGGRIYFIVGPTRIVAEDAAPGTVEVDLEI
jgi:hypothetical protein